ncbi:hypothetical protein AGDE_14504 [Angomonas deanei]|uniref:Uncharacterized protein n=1 Tax=Angomonas deanei TaxID=59799 RepID=A0A7G2CKM6_9TRYP|nr:hypothetical protein AGDE_14504 [Angomonas deanei]CAD2220420.1 hypothetical protein, conserved [Angomonas deanei]|eukprot:EPY20735.1 hypothetical protein AGDE_14504 [Angomonas deanei]
MCSVNNCATCGALSQCLECNPGFVLNGLECVECRVTGCERCDLPNKCAQCPAGQQLNVNADACVDCNVDNCITCSSNNVCTQCAYPYTMSGGVCVLCDIINCNLCEVPNVCKQCVEPLKPSGDRTNCLRCDLADCDACSDDNSCAACAVDNCRNCNATNQCGTCRNGFGENENKCIRCQDEHCQTCTGADGGECLVYLPGYEVEEVVVNKEIPFWVWIIVAIGAFLVFLLICFLIAYCCCGCCHRKKKYNIVYLEDMDDHPLAEKARRLQGDKYRARSTHGSSAATSSNSRGDDGSGSTGSPVTQSTNGYRQAPVHDDDSDDSDDEDNNLIDEGEEPQPFEVDNSPRLSGSSFNNRESYADYANQNNNGYPQQQQQVFPDESPNAIYNNQDVYQDAYNQGGYNQGGYNQGGYNQGGGYY